MRSCSRCVMDETDPGIVFDDYGVCDQCLNYSNNVAPRYYENIDKNSFSSTAERIVSSRGSSDYDSILGLSGGLDSSYLLHRVVVDYGLKPLVFHVDGGWNSDVSVNNIKCMVDKLGLDLFTEVIDWREMRDLQHSFFKSGVAHIDVPQDHAFISVLYKFAKKHKIRYILNGGNYSTEGIRNPLGWLYYGSDSLQLKDIQRTHGTLKLKNYPITNAIWHKFYLPLTHGVRVIKPLNEIEYVKADAEKLLIENYGWRSYPQKHFESRFTKFFEGYWLPMRFGYDTRKPQFSSLIVAGQMSRSDALDRLQSPALTQEQIAVETKFVADKLGIEVEDLMQYAELPKRTYREYRNMSWIYGLGSQVLQQLRLERTAKR